MMQDDPIWSDVERISPNVGPSVSNHLAYENFKGNCMDIFGPGSSSVLHRYYLCDMRRVEAR